ncbi:MAG: hypothetical protein H0W85_04650 [Methylotenera sp.]|nr:hypothetical protein [Methylotenera sp.]
MDKAQTDIPVNKKSNNESNVGENNASNKATTDAATKDKIQLADILKPSTLIVALVTLVLLILLGWYIYVLKPALNENESMIHFMESAYQQKNINTIAKYATKKNVEEKAILPAPNVSQPIPLNVGEASSSLEMNMITGNQITKTQTAKSKKHKTRKHKQTLKPTVVAQRSSSLNQPKCTQAQIVLHQCP